MGIHCPRCGGLRKDIRKYGRYYRTSDAQWITRYHCRACKKHFSSASFSSCYHQNKRRLNHQIQGSLCSLMSQRRIAIVLGISRTTVQRKLKFLALKAKSNHQRWLKGKQFEFIQFDDLETIEHTKCKPVTVCLCVNKNRKIIGYGVAQIPAKGHLAEVSKQKYGKRANHSLQMRDQLFNQLKPYISEKALFSSDEHPHYKGVIRKHFPKSSHETFKGVRGCISGQGELKKIKFDPLFKINHTFAMLRANINRLIRKTWCTTKKIEALDDHIAIYVDFHNQRLTKPL